MIDPTPIFPANALAEFRGRYAAKARHNLGAASPDSLSVAELLERASADELQDWQQVDLGYSHGAGDPVLREQIAVHYPGLSAEHICTFAGAQEAIFVAYHALLKPGDQMQAISPHFGPLHLVAQGLGAQLRVEKMHFSSAGAWSLDVEHWCESLTPSTRLSVINFPHNPTGATLGQQELDNMIAASVENDGWLFSDEVFRGLEYDQAERLKPVACCYDKGISLGVMSKAYGLGGVRVGWIASRDKALHQRMLHIKEYLSICNGRTDELLAGIALRHADWLLERNRRVAQQNLRILEQYRSSMPKLRWAAPKAGFLMYPQVVDAETAEPYVMDMLDDSDAMVIPGYCFGEGLNHFRLGYGRKDFHWQALLSESKSPISE